MAPTTAKPTHPDRAAILRETREPRPPMSQAVKGSRIGMSSNNFRPATSAAAGNWLSPCRLAGRLGRFEPDPMMPVLIRAQRLPPVVRIPAESDAQLVRRSKAGDREAFGTLVQRHAGMVRRLTRAVLRHNQDADDAAQDAFFSAWQALDRFDERQALAPWLARIAVNAARDLRRRRRVRRTEPLEELETTTHHPAKDARSGDVVLEMRLSEALSELPERQRLALLLFEVDGYAHAEIGEMLGIPEGTARSDVFHARRKLRAALGDRRAEP